MAKFETDESLRAEVRRMLRELGPREAARLIGNVHWQTLCAIGAGASVRAGSIAIVREYLRSAKQVA